jgi:Holliday junction resolvase
MEGWCLLSNPSRRKGSDHEVKVLNFFRERGYDAERLVLAGKDDEGDLRVVIDGRHYVVEAKAEKAIDLAGYVREARTEAANYARRRKLDGATPLVIIKKRNASIEDAYVVQRLGDMW